MSQLDSLTSPRSVHYTGRRSVYETSTTWVALHLARATRGGNGIVRRHWQTLVGLTAVALLAGACGTATSPAASKTTNQSKTTIAYIGGITPNPGYDTIYCGVKVAAAKDHDSVYNAGPSSFTVSAQIQAINAVMLRKPSAIVLGPVTPTSVIPSVATAAKAGVPVVEVVSPPDAAKAISFVNPDTNQGGLLAIRYLAKLLPAGGQVAIVGYSPTNGVDTARRAGFIAALKKYPQFTLVSTEFAETVTPAAQLVSTLTLAHPKLKAILVSSATPTQGVAQGIKENNLVGKLKVIGYGISNPPNVVALQDGLVQGVLSQNLRTVGATAFAMLRDYWAHRSIPRSSSTPMLLVTKSNINSPTASLAEHGDVCPT